MTKYIAGLAIVLLGAGIMFGLSKSSDDSKRTADQPAEIIREQIEGIENLERLVVAPGCFWCMEATMQETPGVVAAISGYAGGDEFNPTYEDVYSERTGHRESLMVYYDPNTLSYKDVVDIFWRNIDPTDDGGQFFDRGFSYTTAIFYETAEQKAIAEQTKADLQNSGMFDKNIATSILPYTTFYQAEDYHQDFYLKSADRYQNYSQASGRKEFKERIWEEIQKEEQN